MTRSMSLSAICVLLAGCFAGVHENVRYFVMHGKDSTPAHPKCYFVTQHLRGVSIVTDGLGSADLKPSLDFEYKDAPCTPSALPYSAQGTFKGSVLGYEF